MRVTFLFAAPIIAAASFFGDVSEGEALADTLPVVFSYLVEETNDLDFETAASIAAAGLHPFWDPDPICGGVSRTAAVFNNETRVEIDPRSVRCLIVPEYAGFCRSHPGECRVCELKYVNFVCPYLQQMPAVSTTFRKAWAALKEAILFQGLDKANPRSRIFVLPRPLASHLSEEAENCVSETVQEFLRKFDWKSPEKFHRAVVDNEGVFVSMDLCVGYSTFSLHVNSSVGVCSPSAKRRVLLQLVLRGRDEWEISWRGGISREIYEEMQRNVEQRNFLGLELVSDGVADGPSLKLIHIYPDILDNIVNAEVESPSRTPLYPSRTPGRRFVTASVGMRCLDSENGKNRDAEIERCGKPNPEIIQRVRNLTDEFLHCWEERRAGTTSEALDNADWLVSIRDIELE